MTSVYLSSTYADLEKHRRAVYETLRTIGVDVRDTLEHAVARHERSLEACRQDVQRCDVYVGLFAFRYGFVPEQDNADQQSITELEYRHALENGKPCLIFLADPKGWPLGQTDSYSGDNDSGARIKALRDALTRGHTPRPFDSPTDLANKVQAALRPYLSAEGAGRERCWPEDESPYPGLDYYTEHYAPVYFGREPQVREVLDRLAEPGGDFVLVSGASGSGKSSLVGAGVIPALKAGALDGSRAWEVVRFVPGQDKDPFRSLAMYLFQRLESRVDRLAMRWAAQPESVRADLLRLLASGQDGARGLLFMDQMEELFTATEARHHAPFIDALVGAAGDPVRVIATVRSEFLGECEGHDPLHRLLEAGRHVALWRVGEAALLDMIRRPAQCVGLALDPDLPERLLEGTGREPGNLALLAYALKKLYDLGAAERRLRLSDYEAFGGVQGVVGHIAESAFAAFVKRLGEADPQAAKAPAEAALFRVFRELVTVSAEGVPTRRRAAKARFEGDAAAQALVQRFSDEETRLLVTDRDQDRATLEAAHEALFTSWKTLDRWIGGRRDAERLLAQARLAGREWRESGYAPSRLRHAEWILEARQALQDLERPAQELDDDARTLLYPQARLLAELEQAGTPHTRRAEIGDLLNTLGDPRPGVGLRPDGLPDIDWVPVPEGKVELEDVKGSFEVKAFQIARYPITWTQYRAFVEDPQGYAGEAWWDGLLHEMQPGAQYRRCGNAPADMVSWHDAMAFCRWLTARLRQRGVLSQDKEVRLPTEWEWQQAATGGNPHNLYPWGPDWDDGQANTWGSGLGRTIAVGMYPAATWKGGPLDMAGNIQEWCRNKTEQPCETAPDTSGDWRVLRGGSWSSNPVNARAADRNFYHPEVRLVSIGFRVCCASPIR